ncbi:2891_t:CDS:2 [Dentiscutata erythropus]|uniref:2891_t:CDS:1 n=1 Tax=Dentiscutata erythropus TaxID=1348616 RepID=A0A9N9J082_9GLOM|nr:2891_t:CDS:2 [Dentiscutata erythropus]
MSIYTGDENVSFIPESPKRIPDCNYYRNLWWNKGEFNEQARWDEVTLPHVLATGVTPEDYEERVEKFNIRGCWEWSNSEVIIYEFPSKPHEVCLAKVVKVITGACRNADNTPAEILGFGATRTRDENRRKEADASFRPRKPAVTAPDGSDGISEPWPNLVVEVAYFETLGHVEETLKYWLDPDHAHDCIIVKIDPVPEGQMPARMRAWHYCKEDRRTRNTIPYRTSFEFGTQDGTGAPLNILQGQCIINISLRSLYHDLKPPTQIPLNLNDPIQLDFYFIQQAFILAYDN